MNNLLAQNQEYKIWLKDLKQKLLRAQLKAATQVNSTLISFYWELGADIVERQSQAIWGDGFLAQLSQDLMKEFPDIKGFSRRNLELIRQWVTYWSKDPVIAQQAVAQLIQLPWGHNLKNFRQKYTYWRRSSEIAQQPASQFMSDNTRVGFTAVIPACRTTAQSLPPRRRGARIHATLLPFSRLPLRHSRAGGNPRSLTNE